MFRHSRDSILNWPSVLSVVLLLCFLGYFIQSEYKREHKNIITELREQTFETMLIQLDTIIPTTLSTNLVGTNASVRKSIFMSLDDTIDVNNSGTSFSFSFNNDGVNTIEGRNKKPFTYSNVTSNGHDSTFFSVVQVFDDEGNSSLEVESKEIASIQILKRIWPQMLLSIFLLSSFIFTLVKNNKVLNEEIKLNRMRSNLISNMTHELKTPVSTVSVALESLKNFDAAENPKLRQEYIDISVSEINRLDLLVDKALNMSLYEQGDFKYNKEAIDLKNLISQILTILKVQFDSYNINVKFDHNNDFYFIKGDKIHITNIIHNLVDNAMKYSSSEPQIFVRLLQNENKVHLIIKDNGIGIPKEYQNQIFNKFFRVPKGDIHNIKGHGLGLSYVKEIVEQHNGQISLESEEGIGSTFKISFPQLQTFT